MLKRSLLGVAVMAVWHIACGSSPNAPTGTPPFRTGTYLFTVSAPDATGINGQIVTACPGAGPAGVGHITANAIVVSDGGASIVRPRTEADGNFEARFVSDSTQIGTPLSGSISGIVINTRYPFTAPAVDARASFAGLTGSADAQLTGGSIGQLLPGGTVVGVVVVSNLAGASATCNSGTAGWSLSRVPG